jgi:hypothetical protein
VKTVRNFHSMWSRVGARLKATEDFAFDCRKLGAAVTMLQKGSAGTLRAVQEVPRGDLLGWVAMRIR